MRNPEGFLQLAQVYLSFYQSEIIINGLPAHLQWMVIYVHNNSLEVASVPTGTDQGKLNHAQDTGDFLNWWQITWSGPERDLSASTIKMERESDPSWSSLGLFVLCPFSLSPPKPNFSQQGGV